MNDWNEIEDSRQVSGNTGASNAPHIGFRVVQRRGVRVFRITNANIPRETILQDPSSIIGGPSGTQPLPDYGETWNGMFLDAYDVRPVGMIFDAVAFYSNDGAFKSYGRLNREDPAYAAWSGTFQTAEAEIPFAMWTKTRVPVLAAGGGTAYAEVHNWEFGSQRITYPEERIVAERTLTRPQDVNSAFAACYLQCNKLHLIYGRYYLFESAEFRRTAKDSWLFTYNWRHDPGTRSMPEASTAQPSQCSSSLILLPQQWFEFPPGSGDLWVRPPFHRLIIAPFCGGATGNITDLPYFKAVSSYNASDLTGWATLPGFMP